MTRETEIKDVLTADSTLMTLLTGGVYTSEEVGPEGLRRGEDSPTDAAFDENELLKPCVIIRQLDAVPYTRIRSHNPPMAGITEPLEIFIYQRRNQNIIEQVRIRIFELLEGRRLGKSYPMMWQGESPVGFDTGTVANATVMRQGWQIVSTRNANA